jgi:hypothetical protein
MKGNFMEKINQTQVIAEIMEIGTASQLTLGGEGNRFEDIGAGLYLALDGWRQE